MAQTIFTLEQRPELQAQVNRLHDEGWPRFMREDPVARRYWGRLFTAFAPFQLVVCGEGGAVVATGQTIPLGGRHD